MICRFGEVVREVKKKIDRDNNPYKYYIAGNHMDTDELRLLRKGNFATDDVGPAFIRLFRPGQVLYGSRRTYLRKVAVADFEGVTANTTFVLETKDESKFSQRLLPFLIQSERFTHYSILHSKGSTNPYVLFSDLCDFEFELPPINKQRELADVLWSIEDTRTAYQELATATEEIVKSRFIEMFGDPVINNQGWKKEPLENHADIIVGYPFASSKYVTEGIPIVGGYNLMQGFVQWESSKFWQSADGYEQYLLKDNDIVIAMDRPWVGNGFKIAMIKETDLPAILIQRTACIRCKDMPSEFVYMLLDSTWFANHCQITGSVVPHISNKDILSYEIIVPPFALQNQFADFVALADKSKLVIQETLEKHAAVKAAIMREYF